MAKAGMKRPSSEQTDKSKRNKNEVKPVPEIQGKAKSSKVKANPIK